MRVPREEVVAIVPTEAHGAAEGVSRSGVDANAGRRQGCVNDLATAEFACTTKAPRYYPRRLVARHFFRGWVEGAETARTVGNEHHLAAQLAAEV